MLSDAQMRTHADKQQFEVVLLLGLCRNNSSTPIFQMQSPPLLKLSWWWSIFQPSTTTASAEHFQKHVISSPTFIFLQVRSRLSFFFFPQYKNIIAQPWITLQMGHPSQSHLLLFGQSCAIVVWHFKREQGLLNTLIVGAWSWTHNNNCVDRKSIKPNPKENRAPDMKNTMWILSFLNQSGWCWTDDATDGLEQQHKPLTATILPEGEGGGWMLASALAPVRLTNKEKRLSGVAA